MNLLTLNSIEINYYNLISLGALILFPVLQSYSVLRSLGLPSLYLPLLIYLLLFLAIFHAFVLSISKRKIKTTIGTVLLFCLFFYVIAIILFSANKFIIDLNHKDQYYAVLQTSFIYALMCFLIGSNYKFVISQLINNKRFKLISIVTVLLLLFSIMISIIVNYKETGIIEIKYTKDYLAISDGLAIVLLVLFVLIKKTSIQVVLLPIFVIIVFCSISRGSMLAFVGAIICYKLIGFELKPLKLIVVFILLIIFLYLYKYLNEDPKVLYNWFGKSRGVGIIIGVIFNHGDFYQNDPSMVARTQMLQIGLQDLKNIWVLGRFMREIEIGTGYIHNWLSFWINYGILPFLIFSLTYIIYLMKAIVNYRHNSEILSAVVIIVSFFTLIQIVFFRAYVYSTVWFSLAALVSLEKNQRLIENKRMIVITWIK